MRKSWVLLLGIILVGASLMGARYSRTDVSAKGQKERRILFYRDPMHPWYTSDHPGRAPDCGMPLEPVYADSPASSSSPAGSVTVSGPQQQLIGLASVMVKEEAREESFQTLGRVVPEENRVYSVGTAVDGWVREVYMASTGALVNKNAPLARLFSRDLLTPEQSYLYALESTDSQDSHRFQEPHQALVTQFQLKQAVDELGNLGLPAEQMELLKRSKKLTSEFVVHSPVTGFVLSRNVSQGQRLDKGHELYRIADLRRVWILADISSEQARLIHPGGKAFIALDGKEAGVARVSEILPQYDASARTLRVRLEAENPAYALRPDMFVDVSFRFSLPPAISVPSDAVIDSGQRTIVYVMNHGGSFTRRVVQTGWRFKDRVQIREGLQAGERVVTSGNFLIDSESRMKGSDDD